jgi:enterochelin esterase-like enzyme
MSMGGFGAVRLLGRHPDLFSCAVTYAGAFHTVETLSTRRKTIFRDTFGGDRQRLAREIPTFWVRESRGALREQNRIRMVVGLDDPTLGMNRRFHQELIELEIPHHYHEIPGLGHRLLPYYEQAGLAGFRFGLEDPEAP